MMMEIGIAAALALGPVASQAAQLPPAQVEFRECVKHRESRGNYKASRAEAGSSAQGAYQFLDSKWRRGLSYMVAQRLREHGYTPAKNVRERLLRTPIKRWEPIYQDIGFAAALNARGPWSGWRHWYYPGSRCNGLVAR